MKLAAEGRVPIYGLDYKDERPAALSWLKLHGDPYTTSAFDEKGDVGMDFGVYGVPETFVVDREGIIRYKHIGPLDSEALEKHILPLLAELSSAPGGG
jgi:cytochrome c biogenesis protein CcmG/thiol:disulfide interchange protein DsbE